MKQYLSNRRVIFSTGGTINYTSDIRAKKGLGVSDYYLSNSPTVHVMQQAEMFGLFYVTQQRELTKTYCIIDVGMFEDGGFSSCDCALSIIVVI